MAPLLARVRARAPLGQVYAYRAINPFDPAYGLRFDPDEAIRDIERGNGTTARKMMGRAIRDRYVDVDPEPCDGSPDGRSAVADS